MSQSGGRGGGVKKFETLSPISVFFWKAFLYLTVEGKGVHQPKLTVIFVVLYLYDYVQCLLCLLSFVKLLKV